jgi:hypothetical protein
MNTCVRIAILAITIGITACGPTNNPLFARVEATVGRYQVVVTDCRTFSMPTVDSVDNDTAQRFAPCKDSVVTIKGNDLYVNGEAYGQLVEGDRVVVEHGKVRVDHR